jgi:RimJ/RimL family protein N-acetyltransferase
MPEPNGAEPVINITGEQVALGPLRRDLLPLYTRWRNDFAVQRSKDDPPLPIAEEAYATVLEAASSGPGVAWFTLYERQGPRPIGLAGLFDIDFRHRSAEFAIQIGEADARGRGYGTEATRLMLDFAFKALGLHNVLLRVFDFNYAGRRAYASAGFREIGRREQAWMMGGQLRDVIYMQCLSTWFESPPPCLRERSACHPEPFVPQGRLRGGSVAR